MSEKLITTTVGEVMGKCINFDGEFRCPSCGKLLVPVCVNLGTVKGEEGEKLYCSRGFPLDCSRYDCPSYIFVEWLERYRNTGRL